MKASSKSRIAATEPSPMTLSGNRSPCKTPCGKSAGIWLRKLSDSFFRKIRKIRPRICIVCYFEHFLEQRPPHSVILWKTICGWDLLELGQCFSKTLQRFLVSAQHAAFNEWQYSPRHPSLSTTKSPSRNSIGTAVGMPCSWR